MARNDHNTQTFAAEHSGYARDDEAVTFWERSRRRAQADRGSWDYVLRSGLAGGVAGCVAKTAIAPLDRVKILFQTSNADFKQYAGRPTGLYHAMKAILAAQGLRGLFQGHLATLLRIFPYAGVKFMAYDKVEGILMPNKDMRTPGRLFLAGSLSGVTSVFFTYPLELIRVRLAYQTERQSLPDVIRAIYRENHPLTPASSASSSSSTTTTIRPNARSPMLSARIPIINHFVPFYRGFSVTIVGMIPYAGVSFLTYGTLQRHLPTYFPSLSRHKTWSDLMCGAIAGAVSQTASYPFEVVRRRMQVGGVRAGPAKATGVVDGITWRQAVRMIWQEGKGKVGRGFYVGLSIGYIKVIPLTAFSFSTWQFLKRAMEI
ncbi:mitochondrial carrier domain-containing protein [Filobasidium floriforme]|uniref:mitochondrial carrier domain-containing protein n=1 Tax=Filobasidium floriforme TaxID=5210 RepID=UPI001E8D42B1|nr:mitochondrial carrier domain-containing protein [Filobasidium floriforme]KAH8083056.1 mitochondrial carrier domain-containing protein [Filobasidium floriforme]